MYVHRTNCFYVEKQVFWKDIYLKKKKQKKTKHMYAHPWKYLTSLCHGIIGFLGKALSVVARDCDSLSKILSVGLFKV